MSNTQIVLSYSTLVMLKRSSHNWLNKQMGLQRPTNRYLENGKRLHRIIQDHLCGDVVNPKLAHIDYKFPIVEKEDFDPRCRIFIPINDKYAVHGYVDGLNPETKQILEIKTGSPWSIAKFKESPQRKIYTLALPDYTESVLITAVADDADWIYEKPKTIRIDILPQDKKEALEWIMEGIDILEKGDFTGGLNEEGKCVDKYCDYGQFCMFK